MSEPDESRREMSSAPRVGRFFYQRGFSSYGIWKEDLLGKIDMSVVPVGSVIPTDNDLVIVVKQVLHRPEWNNRSCLWDGTERNDPLQKRGLEFVLHIVRCDIETFVALGWTVASDWSPAQTKLWPKQKR